MTYNWNTMVEITVPTGTNGWLYSGEVIINGVKVRFPVGVPTSVPEPAAVLLKKMIELEQEEDTNTAKPQNHYVGDVTIPAGKTLTLEKGAKFVDNSAPSEVVILPETELKLDDGNWLIPTPLSATPTEGKTCTVTCNGVAYDCPVFNYPGALETTLVMGATKEMGLTGGNDDAPFVVMLLPGGDNNMYGMCMYDGEVDSITLSIVEKAETASAGGGFIVNATIGELNEVNGYADCTCDKTFEEVLAAVKAGQHVVCHALIDGDNMGVFAPVSYNDSTVIFSVYMGFVMEVRMRYDGNHSFILNMNE